MKLLMAVVSITLAAADPCFSQSSGGGNSSGTKGGGDWVSLEAPAQMTAEILPKYVRAWVQYYAHRRIFLNMEGVTKNDQHVMGIIDFMLARDSREAPIAGRVPTYGNLSLESEAYWLKLIRVPNVRVINLPNEPAKVAVTAYEAFAPVYYTDALFEKSLPEIVALMIHELSRHFRSRNIYINDDDFKIRDFVLRDIQQNMPAWSSYAMKTKASLVIYVEEATRLINQMSRNIRAGGPMNERQRSLPVLASYLELILLNASAAQMDYGQTFQFEFLTEDIRSLDGGANDGELNAIATSIGNIKLRAVYNAPELFKDPDKKWLLALPFPDPAKPSDRIEKFCVLKGFVKLKCYKNREEAQAALEN